MTAAPCLPLERGDDAGGRHVPQQEIGKGASRLDWAFFGIRWLDQDQAEPSA
jgi:hypothetical protein